MNENYLKKKLIFIFNSSEANLFFKSQIQFDQVNCIKYEDFYFLQKALEGDYKNNIKYFFDISVDECNKIFDERKIIINNLKQNIKPQLKNFNLIEDFIDHFFHVSLNFMLTINIKIKNNFRFFFYKNNKIIEITAHNEIFEFILNKLLKFHENNIFQNYVPKKIIKINFLNKLIFKLLLYLLSKKIIVGFSGLDYNFKNIIDNNHVKKNIVFLRLSKNNNFLSSNLKNILTLLFSNKNKKKLINLLLPIKLNKLDNNVSINLSLINMYSLEFFKKEFIKKLISPINYIYELNNVFDYFLKNKNFKCFFTYEIKMPENLVFAYNMHKRKIPVFLVSHGSHTYQEDSFIKHESYLNSKGLLYSKFATKNFIQSPIAEEAINRYFPNKLNYEKTLPITWSFNKDFKNNNNNFTILHAGTVKPSSVRPILYENTRDYISNLDLIINNVILLNKKFNVKLIVRARNLPGCSFTFLKNILQKHENVVIKNNGNFLDDLKSCNLLISYSSTTIEEALNSRIPVLLLDKKNNYKHILSSSLEPPTLKKRSAIYFANQNNISPLLESIIDYHSKPLSDSELKNFIWVDKSQCKNFNDQILNTL